MEGTFDIIHCGVGGQGVVLMANTVGLACALSGHRVNSGELHGLSQRSGSVLAHQRIGDKVFSPLVPYGEADVILALEPLEALRYAHFLGEGGSVITNTNVIHPPSETQDLALKRKDAYITYGAIRQRLSDAGYKVMGLDALSIAKSAGNAQVENVVMVGALSSLKGFPVGVEHLAKAVEMTVPGKALEENLKAFRAGRDEMVRLQKI